MKSFYDKRFESFAKVLNYMNQNNKHFAAGMSSPVIDLNEPLGCRHCGMSFQFVVSKALKKLVRSHVAVFRGLFGGDL